MHVPEYQHLQNINNDTNDTMFAFLLTVLMDATREFNCVCWNYIRRQTNAILRIALAFHVFEDENISRDVCRRGDNMFDDSFIIIVLQYCHVVYVTLPTHEITRDEIEATAGEMKSVYNSFSGRKLVMSSNQGSSVDGCNLSDHLINLRLNT